MADSSVTMTETELVRSGATMTIVYLVDIKGLPLADYVAQMTVTPLSASRCAVTNRARFRDLAGKSDAFDAEILVADFYDSGLAGLAELVQH